MTPTECFRSPDRLHRWISFERDGYGDTYEECLYCGKSQTILTPETDSK